MKKIIAVTVFVVIMTMGFFSTDFVNGEPVVVSWGMRAAKTYTKKADGIMEKLAVVKSEDRLNFEHLAAGEILDIELMSKSKATLSEMEKLLKQTEEIDVPESYAVFHLQLTDTIKARIEAEKAIEEYLSTKDPEKKKNMERGRFVYIKKLETAINIYETDHKKTGDEE